jgi:hypothetical protein
VTHNVWKLASAKSLPTARHDHLGIAVNDTMLIYGGGGFDVNSSLVQLQQVYSCPFVSGSLTACTEALDWTGDPSLPSQMLLAGGAVFGGDTLVIYGGSDLTYSIVDGRAWKYSISRRSLVELKAAGAPPPRLAPLVLADASQGYLMIISSSSTGVAGAPLIHRLHLDTGD